MLFTGNQEDLSLFTREAINAAVLDTACTSSVAGAVWLEIYLESLSDKDRAKVKGPFWSRKVFKFGNQGKLVVYQKCLSL